MHLRRAFGFGDTSEFDPSFCLTTSATMFRRIIWPGFPWHPHRRIETITYVLTGTVEHGDSMGNSGIIGASDVQWMTAA